MLRRGSAWDARLSAGLPIPVDYDIGAHRPLCKALSSSQRVKRIHQIPLLAEIQHGGICDFKSLPVPLRIGR